MMAQSDDSLLYSRGKVSTSRSERAIGGVFGAGVGVGLPVDRAVLVA
jgi:hypothetical protein